MDSSASILPQVLQSNLFSIGKRWWAVDIALAIGGILIATGSSLTGWLPVASTIVVAAFTLLGWTINQYWTSVYGLAQRLTRLIEFKDSFGWETPESEISTIRSLAPSRAKVASRGQKEDPNYYASDIDPSTTRAFENLRETAFWSRALSRRMFFILAGCGVGGVLLTILVLILGLHAVVSETSRENVTSLALTILTAGATLGLWNLCLSYHRFWKESDSTFMAADAELERPAHKEREAIILWCGYQASRESAPPLPTWLKNEMHDEIDADYRQCHTRT